MNSPPAPALEDAPTGSIRQWLEALSILSPPSGAMVVGAGSGTSPWVRFLREADVRDTTLVEADPSLFDALRHTISDRPEWCLRQELISSTAGRTDFHRTTLPTENGPVDPEILRALWPNIEITETLELEATPLSELLDNLPSSGGWLVLDRLPARSLVEGTGTPLDKVAVIVARATTRDISASGSESTSHEPLAALLAGRGFTCLMFEPERNPGAGHGLFVRHIPSEAWELETLRASARSSSSPVEAARAIRKARPPVSPAASIYLKLGERENPPPFVLVDSKSLPRSGIHYLQSRLAKLLGSRFSFCEWYHEPGCCRNYPCALDCFVNHAERTGELRLRLIKSHDFELTDPILDAGPHLQRLILARDPVYMLTSWFELEQFETNKAGLLNAGIHVDKIWFHHEKEIVTAAISFVDRRFSEPGREALDAWLADKVRFMGGFVRKWINPEMKSPTDHVHLLRYDRIDPFLAGFLEPYRSYLPPETLDAIDSSKAPANQVFQARTDPFSVKSKRVSEYLAENQSLFEKAANDILACDEHGFFS